MTSASALFFAEAVAGLLVCVLLLLVRRNYTKAYLATAVTAVLLWSAGAAILGFSLRGTYSLLLREAAAVCWAIGAAVTLLAVFEMVLHRPPARRRRIFLSVLFIMIAGGGVALSFFGNVSNDTSLAIEHGTAAALFAGAALVLGLNRRGGRHLALSVGGFSFVILAAIHAAVAATPFVSKSFTAEPALLLGYTIAGLSLVFLIFEDEREASILAASQIELLAYHDSLTGLPNRSLFFDRSILALSQAERYHYRAAVLLFDLDRFKEVNDSLGHHVGDSLLRSVAGRVQSLLRVGDTLARFGGDEFTVLLPRVNSADDAVVVAHKILRALREPVAIGARELVVTSSVGISLYPDDGTDPESLIRNADAAMYRAKERGRDQYELYAPVMSESALAKLELETRLRRALENGELELHYHPFVSLEDQSIYGVEALLRWHSPEYGYIPPQRFVQAAEVSGLIIDIGEWALKEACRQVAKWRKDFRHDFQVAVNLSPRQFRQPDLVLRVQRALAEAQLSPSALELEITESYAIDDVDATFEVLRALKSIGVRIALDDFGTGYSSLSYLQKFPIDTLKLDQSFIATSDRAEEKAIIHGVVGIAHGLGMKVIAEGVETEEQLAMLRKSGCDLAQGYIFTEPLQPSAFVTFVRQNQHLVAGQSEAAGRAQVTDQEKRRALVVDDDPAIRALVKRVLERARFSVDTANDGEQAMEALKRHPYSAIFLDIMMPKMDGYEVIEALKEVNPMALRRVVVMTAIAPSAMERLGNVPIARILPKPFDLTQVIATANDVSLMGMTG